MSEHLSPLLTASEAAAWLRLTEPGGPVCPEGTLRYYRQRGLLRGCRVGKRMLYHVRELEGLVQRLVEREDRRG